MRQEGLCESDDGGTTELLLAVALTALWAAFCQHAFRDPAPAFTVPEDPALRVRFVRDLCSGSLPDAAVRRAFWEYLVPCETLTTSRPTPPYRPTLPHKRST